MAEISSKIEKQQILNIELEIKKEPLKTLSSHFFNNRFFLFHEKVLVQFMSELESFVKIEMFDKAEIFRK